MVQAITGRTSARDAAAAPLQEAVVAEKPSSKPAVVADAYERSHDASIADVVRAAVASGELSIKIPLREGLMRLPVPGNKLMEVEIPRGTSIKLDATIGESKDGPRLTRCTLSFDPKPLVIKNPDIFLSVGGGLMRFAKITASITGAQITGSGKVQIEGTASAWGQGAVDVGSRIPEGTFKNVPMLVSDWFKGVSSTSAKSVSTSSLQASGKPGALDAAAVFAQHIESASISARLAGSAADGKPTDLKLDASLKRVGGEFVGGLSIDGALNSILPVPANGAAQILGAGVEAALQGALSAKADATIGFNNRSLSITARNFSVDLDIASGTVIGDSVNLALGRDTNIALRAASIAVGPKGFQLDKPSVLANLDLGAGHIKLDDSQFEVESGKLTVGAPTDPAMLADVRYSLLAKANASGKADVDAAIAEMQDVFARRVPMVSVSGEAKVDASL